MEKLAADLQSKKDKAEKTAKALVQASLRKNQQKENKENKKKRKAQDAVEDAAQKLQMEVDSTKAELQKMQQSEEEEKLVEAAISKALSKCSMATSVPLTIMNQSEPVEKSARAKAMQDALKTYQSKLEVMKNQQNDDGHDGSDPVPGNPGTQESVLGIQAALHVLRQEGSVSQKKAKIATKKDEKALTAVEMKRLGKHLLK